VDLDSALAIISLNRPKHRNAISRIMTLELDNAFGKAADDTRVKVIILRGEGPHFSSGHDLGTTEQNDDLERKPYELGMRGEYEKWASLDVEMCLRWRQIPKPVLCGLKGYTIYHACSMASIADIIIAADNLKYFPSLIEYNPLPWDLNLNTRKTKEIYFLQRFILAEEAKELGLVNLVVPENALDEELIKMGKHIAKADSFYLRMMKLTCNQAQDNAGLTVHTRSSLSHWAAYRGSIMDPAALGNYSELGVRKLAPVKLAEGDGMYWSKLNSPRSRL